MAAAKKKEKKAGRSDPIADRASALTDQIAALEAEIKRLDAQLQSAPAAPKLRSTAIPRGATVPRKAEPPPARPADGNEAAPERRRPAAHEPIFEEVKPPHAARETAAPDQFNGLGLRKYDLPALLARLRGYFSRPAASNPRLVTYLAAGGVQGLRPLRYEKRVARNRFILLVVVLFVILLGVISVFVRNHR
ncbi:MAG: hypothetical protein KGR98_15570 [Verrucomicrobia bacterium]|nr:hypothetical protein [Verrucomicrobiota bacterium]